MADKRKITTLITLGLLAIFSEHLQAAVAIVMVGLSILVAVSAWYWSPDHWYWIAVPAIALISATTYPILKWLGDAEKRFDHAAKID